MRLAVRITPNASRDEMAGRMADGRFRIKVQSPPVDGSANKRLVRFVAKAAGVPRSRVRIVQGETSRDKVLEITGDDREIISNLEGA